jgi:hypothetical protein
MQLTPPHKPQLELGLPEIQSYLAKVINSVLRKADFNFNRNDFSFHKKFRKSSAEVGFVFVSQFPVNYKISFSLLLWHPKITKIKQRFMKEILQRHSNLSSVSLYMNDFSRLAGADKETAHPTIYNHKDLFIAAEEMSQLILGEVIPLCEKTGSVSELDEFYAGRPDWSVNTLGGSNVCTDLIAARLNGRRDHHFVYESLKEQIRQKIKLKEMSPESLELLSLCYDSIR